MTDSSARIVDEPLSQPLGFFGQMIRSVRLRLPIKVSETGEVTAALGALHFAVWHGRVSPGILSKRIPDSSASADQFSQPQDRFNAVEAASVRSGDATQAPTCFHFCSPLFSDSDLLSSGFEDMTEANQNRPAFRQRYLHQIPSAKSLPPEGVGMYHPRRLQRLLFFSDLPIREVQPARRLASTDAPLVNVKHVSSRTTAKRRSAGRGNGLPPRQARNVFARFEPVSAYCERLKDILYTR